MNRRGLLPGEVLTIDKRSPRSRGLQHTGFQVRRFSGGLRLRRIRFSQLQNTCHEKGHRRTVQQGKRAQRYLRKTLSIFSRGSLVVTLSFEPRQLSLSCIRMPIVRRMHVPRTGALLYEQGLLLWRIRKGWPAIKSDQRKTPVKKMSEAPAPPKEATLQMGLVEFLANSPLAKFRVGLKRKRDHGRKIQL
jgi:hypothetical protein